ncbi:hypothetical protein GCM10007170_32890 [Arthrobacter liuii]|uniref:Uncharacterized protein n=1 Tax=Arthrobacter liuii TaxID=1476996 RepID=A0ABQ2AZ63_9MICC|nr:hypothetical protein GCM10007170_32890 [Arthrobacter liuii]
MGCGSCVAGGLAGADDGGAAAGVVGAAEVPAGAVGVGVVVVPAVVLGLALPAVGLAVALGAAELVVGDGLGGPKQAVRTSRPLSPRTLNAVSLGLVMVPPLECRHRGCGTHIQATPEGYSTTGTKVRGGGAAFA